MTAKPICLVVEDSDVIREIAVRIINDLGLESAEATGTDDALNICREKKPDAVFLDWDLPSLGALDFLKGVSELPENDKPNVILCATENDPQQFSLAKAAGAAHHILKPFDKTSIENVLREIGLCDGDAIASAVNG